MTRRLMVWLVAVALVSTCLMVVTPAVQAATPQYLDLGDPIEAGLGGWQEYWDLTKHVAVVHTSDEALRIFNDDLQYNQPDVGGGLKDYGEQEKPAGKQMIEATPLLNVYQERSDVKAGHLYVVKTKSSRYFALYMDSIQEIDGDTCMAFTLYPLPGAPLTTHPTQPLQPRNVITSTTHHLDLGAPIEGGIGDDQNYWDLAKQVPVVHTSSEALRQYNKDLAYNQADVGGGLKDYGEQSKPAGKKVIQATPVLNMFQERLKVTAGHLYVVKTKSLGYFALYMDDIQEVNGTTLVAFTVYKMAGAPTVAVPSQPTQPTQPTQPSQPSQPTPTQPAQPTPPMQPSQPTNQVPIAPNGLTVASNTQSVKLTWTVPTGKTSIGYYIYRGTKSGAYGSMPLSDFPIKVTEYTDTNVEVGKTYFYIVKAVWGDNSESEPSNEVSALVTAPAATQIKTEIWLQVDNPKAKVDGKWQDLQAAPRMSGERVIVPFRFIGQSIGAEINFVSEEQKVTYKLGDLFLELWLNQSRVRINGKESTLDVPPMLVDGQYTFVPLRFVASQLGAQLAWNPDDNSVTITSVRTVKNTPAPTTPTTPPTPSTPTAPTTPTVPEKPVSKQLAYWVEGGVRLVIDGDVVYEDNEGIYNPVIDPKGQLIAYSRGSNELILGNSEGKNTIAYKHPDVDYRVYPMTWSGDGTEILFITSYRGGFVGGNQVGILNLDTEKVEWVFKGATAADWAADGRIIVSTVDDLFIVDRLGRTQVDLTPPEGGLFTSADDPTFSPDGTALIYQFGEDFYIHGIAKDQYIKAITTAYEGDPARMAEDFRIIYVDKKIVKVFDPESGETVTLSKSSDCSYPGWMKGN